MKVLQNLIVIFDQKILILPISKLRSKFLTCYDRKFVLFEPKKIQLLIKILKIKKKI